MAQKSHRTIRASRTRGRAFAGKCEGCGKPLCSCSAYQYTDESNATISHNSPWLCIECYAERYGVRLKSAVEAYRENLIWRLFRLRSYLGDPLKIDAIDMLIRILEVDAHGKV